MKTRCQDQVTVRKITGRTAADTYPRDKKALKQRDSLFSRKSFFLLKQETDEIIYTVRASQGLEG